VNTLYSSAEPIDSRQPRVRQQPLPDRGAAPEEQRQRHRAHQEAPERDVLGRLPVTLHEPVDHQRAGAPQKAGAAGRGQPLDRGGVQCERIIVP
jgi:hypothetical protein